MSNTSNHIKLSSQDLNLPDYKQKLDRLLKSFKNQELIKASNKRKNQSFTKLPFSNTEVKRCRSLDRSKQDLQKGKLRSKESQSPRVVGEPKNFFELLTTPKKGGHHHASKTDKTFLYDRILNSGEKSPPMFEVKTSESVYPQGELKTLESSQIKLRELLAFGDSSKSLGNTLVNSQLNTLGNSLNNNTLGTALGNSLGNTMGNTISNHAGASNGNTKFLETSPDVRNPIFDMTSPTRDGQHLEEANQKLREALHKLQLRDAIHRQEINKLKINVENLEKELGGRDRKWENLRKAQEKV